MLIHACLPLLLGLAQGSATPIEKFRKLERVDRATLARMINRQLSLDPDPVIQRIVSMQRSFLSYPLATPSRYHHAAQWAKGSPKRTLVRAGEPGYASARATAPKIDFVPELARAVWFDWGSGKVVRRAKPLSDEETFRNFLAGFAPGSDETLAQILAILDADKKQRKIAAYAAHLYADLGAHVYEDITIYESWYGGKVRDVPDVDAIPFAVRILGTHRYRSPIPAGPARTMLYRQISEAIFAYRKYRTLREAAAAAYICSDPDLPDDYARLVPRFHYLYAHHDEDPLEVARHLQALPDRAAFLGWADKNVRESQAEMRQRERRRKALLRMNRHVRRLALAELDKTIARALDR